MNDVIEPQAPSLLEAASESLETVRALAEPKQGMSEKRHYPHRLLRSLPQEIC